MNTGDMLLADILANPDDDGLRLIYADWLEDDGDRRWAEFIRAQVELSRTKSKCGSESGDYLCWSMSCPMCPLIRRQNEAWLNLAASWICLFAPHPFALTIFAGPDHPPPVAHVRRGFTETVQCRWADWMRHGPSIVAFNPVGRVQLVDKSPEAVIRDHERTEWTWYVSDTLTSTSSGHVSNDIWRRMGRMMFPSMAEANDALSAACLDWAKWKAKQANKRDFPLHTEESRP